MRKLLLVSGALLAGLGIVSTKLWLDLKAERQASSDLRTQLDEARISPRAPTQVVAANAPTTAPACVASANPAPPPVDSDAINRAMSAAISAGVIGAATGLGEQDLLKDPEYRKAQLTVARLKLAQSNPGLAEALGFSEKEANHLFEVMAEQQLKLTAEFSSMTTASGGLSAKVLQEITQRANAQPDPVRAMLGDAKYTQYQEYQRNVRPALTQVASIGSTLTAAGQPLDDSQSRGLASAMLAEQQRQRQETALPRANPNPGAPRNLADAVEESAKRLDESNRRILEASSAYLNATQQQVLKDKFDQQVAQRRKTIESAKDLDARRQSPTQLPTAPNAVP